MNTQELIQEAAVIRDERNQYANTAERVGTALVHMAEQIAAQGADVDKIEAEVRWSLTLAQLDNPLGFTTNMQWAQGLNEDKTYTFRLVDTSGRCIGHVWLLNDADYPTDRSQASRLLEMVMCCASIDTQTGALTTDARWGSPRLYYRTFCTPLSGGTPDGGAPAGIFKWSAWQEYREYVSKPIKDALAALQQQHATDVAALQQQHSTDVADLQAKHATDVADLQASINATLAAIPTGVLNLGMSADADTILAEAAKYAVASDPFKAVITGQYMVGTAVQSIVIHQQVTKSSNGAGVCMQYVYKDKARYTRYINFNAAASVTAVQGLQPDGVRNLYYTDTGFIGQRDAWGTQVGSGFFLPNKNDLREGTPTATSVPLVLTKAIKDTVTCNLGAATTARAGVMTVEQVKSLGALSNMWLQIDEEFAEIEDIPNYFQTHPDIALNDTYKFFQCRLNKENFVCDVWGMKSVRLQWNSAYVGIYFMYGEYYEAFEVALWRDDEQSEWGPDEIVCYTPMRSVEIQREGDKYNFVCLYASEYQSAVKVTLPIADANSPGFMTAAHVQKLANLEARIAALEAK